MTMVGVMMPLMVGDDATDGDVGDDHQDAAQDVRYRTQR